MSKTELIISRRTLFYFFLTLFFSVGSISVNFLRFNLFQSVFVLVSVLLFSVLVTVFFRNLEVSGYDKTFFLIAFLIIDPLSKRVSYDIINFMIFLGTLCIIIYFFEGKSSNIKKTLVLLCAVICLIGRTALFCGFGTLIIASYGLCCFKYEKNTTKKKQKNKKTSETVRIVVLFVLFVLVVVISKKVREL